MSFAHWWWNRRRDVCAAKLAGLRARREVYLTHGEACRKAGKPHGITLDTWASLNERIAQLEIKIEIYSRRLGVPRVRVVKETSCPTAPSSPTSSKTSATSPSADPRPTR